VSTHCTPETVKPSSSCIDGMAVRTIVASRMTMKNASPSRASAFQRRGSACRTCEVGREFIVLPLLHESDVAD
jgi:hypothetical protein